MFSVTGGNSTQPHPLRRGPGSPWLPTLLISVSLLIFEISLIRVLALIYWHHQAQLILAGALLGTGAGGVVLATARRWWLDHHRSALTLIPLVYLLVLASSYRTALRLPFNPLELAWHPSETANLLLLHFVLSLPFLAGSLYIGLALMSYEGREHTLYGSALLGSGLGALIALLGTSILPPSWLITPAAVLGALSAAALPESGVRDRSSGGRLSDGRRRTITIILGLALTIPVFWPRAGLEIHPSSCKSESQALLVPGAEIVAESYGSQGYWRALRGPSLHYAPGLSLGYTEELPPQMPLYVDGEPAGAATELSGFDYPDFLRHLPTALPYELRPVRSVFIVGLDGGFGALEALAGGAREVVIAETQKPAVSLLEGELRDFSGDLVNRPGLDVRLGDGRMLLRTENRGYDLIQLAYLEGLGPAGAGLFAARENYELTVEAISLYLSRLNEKGILAQAHWFRLPPRDGLRTVTTLVRALGRMGIRRPSEHLLVIRSWNTTLTLASLTPFSPEEVDRARDFCRRELFDPVYHQGITPEEINRVNRLSQPFLHDGIRSILFSEDDSFAARYPFDISPSTDDAPYFSHFLRWRALPELWTRMGRDIIPYLEGGYLLLVGALFEGTLLGALLLILPFISLGRQEKDMAGRALVYFASIGLGFMILEMAVMGKIDLVIGQPTVSVGLTVTGFLVFSGIGSLWGNRAEARGVDPLGGAAVFLLVMTLVFPWVIEPLAQAISRLDLASRAIVVLVLQLPLAFPLGLFFPAGLARLARQRPALVPWAWGVNGFASVVGTLTGALFPLDIGFVWTIGIAGACYALAGAVRFRSSPAGTREPPFP